MVQKNILYLNKTYNIVIIVCTALITIFLMLFVVKTKFDYDFDKFFPQGGEETKFFNEFIERYGSDNDFLIVAFENSNHSIYQTNFLNQVDSIANQVKLFDYVENIQIPTQINYYIKEKFLGSVFEIPYLHKDSALLLKQDSIQLQKLQSPVTNFISKDGKGLYMLVKHKDHLNDKQAFKLLDDINNLLSKYKQKTYLGGRIVGHTYYIDLMKRETIIFVAASVFLIVFFLILTFKSFYGVLIPFLIVSCSVLWVIGVMGVLGVPLNIVLNIMPTILMVIGISGVVHFLSKYIDKIRERNNKQEAITYTMKQVGKAIIFTSITTMIGFLSLLTAKIPAIEQFGLITAFGVGIILLLALTLLPSVLNLMKLPKLKKKKTKKNFWDKKLPYLFFKISKKRKHILIFSTILILVCIYGTLQIKSNNYIMEDLKHDNPLKIGYNHLEKKYNGASPFDMNIEIIDTTKNALSPEVFYETEKLQNFVEKNYKTSRLFSPLSVLKEINVTESNGDFEKYKLPRGKKMKKAIRILNKNLSTKNKKKKIDLSYILSEDQKNFRITGTMGDIGSYKARKLHRKLDTFVKDSINTDLILPKLTNGPYLMQINNEILTKNILTGLLIAFLIIGIIVGVIFKSIKMIFLSLIPNTLPLIMIGAIMGFCNIDMKISTSLVFTIAFGIAVDDTIHFLSTYKFYIKEGLNKMLSLEKTFVSTGKAIVLTTLILSGGFLTLTLSDFLGTFYIGLLISLTLIFAVFADLILLPVLILTFYDTKNKL